MTLALPWKTTLQSAALNTATEVFVTDDITDLCACLAEPSHIMATIYTATKYEQVILTGCNGTAVQLNRGLFGTDAMTWPAGACLRVDEIVAGAVPEDGDDCGVDAFDTFGNQISGGAGSCDMGTTFDELNVGKGLQIDRTDPLRPVLRLADSGVTAGTYGGAEVNACGQFTSVPAGWPASALPVFDPCCDDTGTGGAATNAVDVSFAPAAGNTVATGANVQVVLQQIDDYLTAFVTPTSGVQSVTAGTGVTVAGTAADPVVSLTNTGIAAGTYDGFTVDPQGRITNYATPAASDVVVAGTAPIAVAYNAGTMTYTVSVGAATKTVEGVVQLADEADIATPTAIPGDHVVTWDFLQQWGTSSSGIASVVAGLPGFVVTYDGISEYSVQPAPDLVTADGNPIVVTYDTATGKFVVDIVASGVGQFGAVQLADSALVATPGLIGVNDVVTLAFLEAWATDRGI